MRNVSTSNTPQSLLKHVRLHRKGVLMLKQIKGDMKRINADLGLAFKIERLTRRIAQGTVVRRMGVSQGYLSGLERGTITWTDEVLQKAFDALENHGRQEVAQ